MRKGISGIGSRTLRLGQRNFGKWSGARSAATRGFGYVWLGWTVCGRPVVGLTFLRIRMKPSKRNEYGPVMHLGVTLGLDRVLAAKWTAFAEAHKCVRPSNGQLVIALLERGLDDWNRERKEQNSAQP